jgi:hypothetical protein
MLTAEAVLQIIRLSLEITLEIIKGIPDANKEKFWDRHEKRMEFWENLFRKLNPPTP